MSEPLLSPSHPPSPPPPSPSPPPPSPSPPPSGVPIETVYVIGVAVSLLALLGVAVFMYRKTLYIKVISPLYVKVVHPALTFIAASSWFKGLVPPPPPLEVKIGPLAFAQEELKDVELEKASAAAQENSDYSKVGKLGREALRERIAPLSAEERSMLAAETAELSMAEQGEIQARAEAAVASSGTPEAALLAAVSRSASALEVRALLQRGANPDAAFLDKSALAVASRNCSAAVVKVLIDGGATLDMKDVWGWTPLMHAIDAHTGSSSREPVLMLLLDAGASVDVWGKDLKGPLDMMEAREEQIKKAREQEASVGKQTSSHLTAPGAANPVVDSRACEARRLSVNQPRRLTNIMRQKSGGGSGCRRSLDSETPNFCVAGHQYVSSSPVPPRFSAVANASERV